MILDGQGHETTFCQIAADRLGLPIEHIDLVEGDTDRIPFGNGTWGARSVSVAGTAIYRACDKVLDKALRFAAQALECAESDVDYAALWHLGVRDISLPITSETVWRAVRDAAARESPLQTAGRVGGT